jgi:hypothetical protein
MVKSPKIRHSKQHSEPVTIDLSAEEVKRSESQPGMATKDAKAEAVAKPTSTGASEAARATSAPSAAAGTATDKQDKADGGQARPDKPAGAASSSASSFGRSSGPASQAKPQDAPKQGAAAAKPAEPRRSGGMGALTAGLAGGVIALVGAGALYLGGYLPAPSAPVPPATDNTTIERLETELSAMREEIAALKSAPPAESGGELNAALAETNTRVENMAVLVEDLRGELSRLSETVAAGGGDSAALDAMQARLAKIEQSIADLPAGGDTEAISSALADVTEQVGSIRSALDGLNASTQEKFAAIDESLASLGARIDEQENEPGVALAIAASALKAAIDRGQPFANELETFARLAPDAPEIEALRSYAATGVPTAAAIAGETDAVAQRIIAAAKPDNANAGLLDRLWASAESLITVRPIGAVEGDSVPAIVARMEAAIKNGDYAAASAEYETLPDGARAAGADFIAKVKARQAADELVSKVLADALRA